MKRARTGSEHGAAVRREHGRVRAGLDARRVPLRAHARPALLTVVVRSACSRAPRAAGGAGRSCWSSPPAGLFRRPPVAREHLLAGIFFNPSGFLLDGAINEDIWDAGVDIPFARHGRDASVSIWRWYGTNSVLINGKAVATNQVLADVQHLALLGHLPMAVHQNPQRVLVVGLGMGTTYKAAAEHKPQVLRVVEIEESVVGGGGVSRRTAPTTS